MFDAGLEKCNGYHIVEIDKSDSSQFDRYMKILADTYAPLDFFQPCVIPKQNTTCYGIWHEGELEGIFGMTPLLPHEQSVFVNLIDDIRALPTARLIEISNVVLRKKIRGDVALGAMLYEAAVKANQQGFDFLVGITRYQTLRYFVNFGVTPVLHEPLHLMGKSSIDDYVIYFDTHCEKSVLYMHERARRYFKQESVMAGIKSRYQEIRRTPIQLSVGEANDAQC